MPPPRASLVFARGAEEAAALALLAARPEVAPRARGEDRVRLLWDVCQVTDFRKLLFEAHVDFLAELFVALAEQGALSDELVDAPPQDFVLGADTRLTHQPTGRVCGRLVAGPSVVLPDALVVGGEALGAGARQRLERRLRAAARDAVGLVLGDLPSLTRTSASADVRGLGHRLEQGLGTLLAADAHDLLARLTAPDRDALEAAGVRVGAGVVYLGAALRPEALAARVGLARAFWGGDLAELPRRAASFAVPRGVDPRALVAIGFFPFGVRAVRSDVLDVLIEALLGSKPPDAATIARWTECTPGEVPRLLACALRP